MNDLFTAESLKTLVTLSGLEIVLGIDNLVVLAIVAGKLDRQRRKKARQIGLSLAMIMRVLLLLTIGTLSGMKRPFVAMFDHGFSVRDLVLVVGGVFLVIKSAWYLGDKLFPKLTPHKKPSASASFRSAIIQIVLLDLVFSIDSVITAVGLSQQIPIMVAAIVIAVLIMMFFAGPVGEFVHRFPTIETLALAFLVLVGAVLVVEGFGGHVDHNLMYMALAFALAVEALNMKIYRAKPTEVASKEAHPNPEPAKAVEGEA